MCYVVPGVAGCYQDFDLAVAAAIAVKGYVLAPAYCTHGKDYTDTKEKVKERHRAAIELERGKLI